MLWINWEPACPDTKDPCPEFVFDWPIKMPAANDWAKGGRVEPLELHRLGPKGEEKENHHNLEQWQGNAITVLPYSWLTLESKILIVTNDIFLLVIIQSKTGFFHPILCFHSISSMCTFVGFMSTRIKKVAALLNLRSSVQILILSSTKKWTSINIWLWKNKTKCSQMFIMNKY